MVKIDLQFFDDRSPLAVYSRAAVDGPPPDVDRARPAAAIGRDAADESARRCDDPLPQVSPDGVTRQTHALLRRIEDALCNGQEHAS